MVIVALADIHGKTERLKVISQDLSAADVVLLVGDLTNFGRRAEVSRVVRAVREYNDCIFAVLGNCDYPEVGVYLAGEGLNLHRKSIIVNGVAFVGVGGSLPCPGRTPNEITEGDFDTFLKEAVANLDTDVPVILVIHQPPLHTVADLARNGKHVGSKSIRSFIAEAQPMICFTGHIHEGRGIDSIGKTKVVNPGPLREGGYAYATVNNEISMLEIRGI